MKIHQKVLSGLTYTCKDNIATGATTASSKILKTYQSPFNATVVELLNDAGAKLIEKVKLDEFGMGSSGLNSALGPVVNPIDHTRIVGGSSSGSAASVASGCCDFSIGSDTGGSIRLPASYCNILGFKPSYGRISRWGLIPYAQTLDTIGILSKKIEIIKQVYSVLNKIDEKDPTSITYPESKTEEKIIVIPQEFILEELSFEVKHAFSKSISILINLGYTVKTVAIPSIKKALPTYYTLATAEAASNLSRYDGTRYGESNTYDKLNNDIIFKNRSQFLSSEVKRRIILGNYTLSSSSGDHYLKATLLRKELTKQFPKCLMIAPTAMGPAPRVQDFIKEEDENLLNGYVNDILTVPASLAGLPSISVPIDSVGIQVMGPAGDDEKVLDLAEKLLLFST